MPQLVDLESLVRVGDSKVACESTLAGSRPEPDPDLPAESFRVSVSDLDWVVSINSQLDRDDSTKGTTNPKSHLHPHHGQPVAGPTTSQRFSGNLKATAKAPIIGLPNKIQHSGYLGHSARRAQVRIFPKRGVNVSDPGSPKVSCFGKVVSQRERRRSPEAGGCWASLFGCFRRRNEEDEEEAAAAAKNERNFPAGGRTEVAPAAEPPGLGGMKRFVSGRRPASWGGDVEFDLEGEEIGHVAWSGPLDRR